MQLLLSRLQRRALRAALVRQHRVLHFQRLGFVATFEQLLVFEGDRLLQRFDVALEAVFDGVGHLDLRVLELDLRLESHHFCAVGVVFFVE